MIDVAHAAIDNGAKLTLPMADARRDAAEIGTKVDALQHDHVARLGEIMRFDFAEPGDARFDFVRHWRPGGHIAHGERPADQSRRRIARRQQGRRHDPDNAKLVHCVGRDAGEIWQRTIAVEHVLRQHRQVEHAESVVGELAESCLGHPGKP
jgi:hypothetical protein